MESPKPFSCLDNNAFSSIVAYLTVNDQIVFSRTCRFFRKYFGKVVVSNGVSLRRVRKCQPFERILIGFVLNIPALLPLEMPRKILQAKIKIKLLKTKTLGKLKVLIKTPKNDFLKSYHLLEIATSLQFEHFAIIAWERLFTESDLSYCEFTGNAKRMKHLASHIRKNFVKLATKIPEINDRAMLRSLEFIHESGRMERYCARYFDEMANILNYIYEISFVPIQAGAFSSSLYSHKAGNFDYLYLLIDKVGSILFTPEKCTLCYNTIAFQLILRQHYGELIKLIVGNKIDFRPIMTDKIHFKLREAYENILGLLLCGSVPVSTRVRKWFFEQMGDGTQLLISENKKFGDVNVIIDYLLDVRDDKTKQLPADFLKCECGFVYKSIKSKTQTQKKHLQSAKHRSKGLRPLQTPLDVVNK